MNLYNLISKYRKPLMGLAAIWIMIFHDWFLLFTNTPGLFEIEYIVKKVGDTGVSIFLFLSGMGLVKSIQNKTTKEFYISRLKRIIIPTLITGIACFFVNKWDLLLTIKVITGIAFSENPVTFLWFFYAILILYLLFPVYYHFYKKTNNHLLFTLFVLIVLLVLMYINMKVDFIDNSFYLFFNRIPIFIIGILFSKLENNKDVNMNICLIISITLLVLGIKLKWDVNISERYIIFPCSTNFLPELCLCLGICFVISFLLDKIKQLSFITKLLAFFGAFSYELYCAQEIVQRNAVGRVLEQYMPIVMTNFVVFGLDILIALCLHNINKVITKKISK